MMILPKAYAGNEDAGRSRTVVSKAGQQAGGSSLGEKLQEQFPDAHSAGFLEARSCRRNAGCQEENLPLVVASKQAQLLLQLHHTHGPAQVLQ